MTPLMVMLFVVFLFLLLLPIIGAELFPILKILMLGYFCLLIFTFVTNILGRGVLGYAVAGILIYIFVIRLWPLFAAAYMLYLLIGFGISGIIIFSLPRTYPRIPGISR